MKQLEEKFDEIIDNNPDTTGLRVDAKKCAEECRNVAVEFAKALFLTPIKTQRMGKILKTEEEIPLETNETYIPKEFMLMLGQLMAQGDNLFDKFINDYYISKLKR